VVATATEVQELLVLTGITKVFPNGTRALRGVDLSTGAGTIHGLVGANGAGKSTLIKIMSGAIEPSEGAIRWRGAERCWARPGEALKAGIATVHQHSPLVPTLSVVENVFLAARGGWRWRVGDRLAELSELFETVGYELTPERVVGDLAIGDRQMVAILQAISQRPQLLILDEPTASLSMSEREIVHTAMDRLRDQGTGVVFISHLLDEVMELASAITVLRDGRVTLDSATVDLTHDTLVTAIVGREMQSLERSNRRERSHSNGEPPVLDVRDVRSPGRVGGVTFSVAPGEVVGLAGLLGAGRSEILHAIYGADPDARGTVHVGGRTVARNPVAAVRAGMALVPEDRGGQGLVPGWEIWRNVTLPALRQYSWWGVIPRHREEMSRALTAVKDLNIQPPFPEALVDELSGGNAQKTVFAKWLHAGVRVLLLDEPTVGIDIGAKLDIQLLIRALTEQGVGVVVVDSEFAELLTIADRVLVVRRGRLTAERSAVDTTETELLALASGLIATEERGTHG
jgi:ribose transport system ATP-binding protein